MDVSSREQGRKAEHASTDGLRASTIDALSSSQVIHDKQQGPGHSAVTTSGGGAPPFAPKITSGYTALRPHPSGQQRKPSPSRKTPVHPRKFYLAKGSFEILSRRSVSPAGISKTKRLRKSEVACFVEGRKRQAVGKERSRFQSKLDGKTPDAVSGSAVESSISRTERRKPHATAAEKAWRANEWNDPKTETSDASESNNVSTTSFADSNDDLLKLASELQAFALKQSQANEKSVSQPLSERSLKFKPKPPKDRPRRRDHQPGSVSPELDAFNEEDDFVMDTYIRSEFDSSRRSEHDEQMIDPTEHLQTENIGILIIEEEDEAIWDAYVGGLGTESDGVDEEEDENGMLSLPLSKSLCH